MSPTPEPSHAPYPGQPHSGTSGIPAMPQGQAAKPVSSQRPAMPPLPMRPQNPAMPQRPAPRPTGYLSILLRFHRQPHHAAFLHVLYSRITRYRPQAPIRFRVFGRLPFTACLLNASHPRKSHANAIIAIVLVAAFVVLAVGAVAAKNRQIKEHEAVTKQSKIVYDNAIQVTERTVISSMSILRLQVIPMCCPTCIFSPPSSMSYRIVRCSSHAEPRNPSSQVTAMRGATSAYAILFFGANEQVLNSAVIQSSMIRMSRRKHAMPRQNISSTIRVKRLRVRFMMNTSADDRIPFPSHSPRRVFHRAEHTGVSSGRNKQRTIFYNGAVWFCRMPKHGLTKERYDTTTRGLDDYQAHCRL